MSPAFGTLSLNPARGTLGIVGALGQGAFSQGAYSAQPDFTSSYGFMTDYHSPSFDPGGRSASINSPSYDPNTGQLDFGFDISPVGPGRSAGRGGPPAGASDTGDFSVSGPSKGGDTAAGEFGGGIAGEDDDGTGGFGAGDDDGGGLGY